MVVQTQFSVLKTCLMFCNLKNNVQRKRREGNQGSEIVSVTISSFSSLLSFLLFFSLSLSFSSLFLLSFSYGASITPQNRTLVIRTFIIFNFRFINKLDYSKES